MIKIASFSIDEAEAANAFMEKHTPLTNKENALSGIQLNMGSIVIFYEDGVFNYQNLIDRKQTEIINKIQSIELHKGLLVEEKKKIKTIAPKGYKSTLTQNELVELCKADGSTHVMAKDRAGMIIAAENQILMSTKTISLSMEDIETYKAQVEEYKKITA